MHAPAQIKATLGRTIFPLQLLFALIGLVASTAAAHAATVATPTFSPVAGTYTNTQSVTITTTTSGASIRFTTDGSTPSSTAGTLYSTPVSIGVTTTLKAIAFKSGSTNSAVASGTYTMTAAAPVFSPAAGTFNNAQTVTITSATSGASIRYTTDGSTPSATAGTLYSGPVSIGVTTTLKAIAFKTGFTNSVVTSGTYTMTAAAPTFSPVAGTYTSAQTVTITTATSSASIRYTTDGSTPSATAGTLYSGPVTINATTTLKAIAFKTGFTNSTVTSGTYTMTAAAPVFSPAAGAFNNAQTVTITSATSGASIRYTIDGTTPSATAGTLYSGPVSIGVTTTLKAIAFKTGFTNSAVSSGTYTMTATAPTFSPAAGTFNNAQTVTITTATSGASIRYTTDGSTPSATAGTLYSGPVNIGATTTLKAIAFKTGFTNSTVTSGTYTMTVAAPVFSPAAGAFSNAQTVTITTATSGASIRYTIDGTTPSSTAGTLYSGPVTIGATTTLKAIAFKTGFTNSTVTSGTYTMTATAPTFSPAAGTFNNAQTVTITTTTSGASIRYTTDGSTPSATAGTLYSTPVSIGATTTLKAIAFKTGFTNSTVTSGIYTMTAAAPMFSPAFGTFTNAQTVAITSATSGASIRYTTNGSTPTETTGNLYSGSLTLNSTTTLTAIAYKSGFTDSTVTSGLYTINLPPTITPDNPSLTFSSSDDVSLSFTASDANGPLSKVELYRNGVLDSTLTNPTSGSTWTFAETSTLPPGTYTFTGIAYNNFGGSTTSAPVIVAVLPSLPYLTDFESSEGYILGSLNQQLGWSVLQGSALVTNLDHFSGTQSTVLPPSVPPAQITQVFAPFVPPAGAPNIIFVDFFAKPVAEADVTTATTFNVGSARFAFVLNGGQGSLEAFNGNGSGGGAWSSTSFTVPLAANHQSQSWVRLTARLDFTQGTWDLYANGAMVAANQGFLDSASLALTSFSVQGDAGTASEIDDILAGTNNPLFADVNNDGIDDAWETAHGLSLSTNDRNLTAANGSTVLQDYLNGIDPTDTYGGVLPVLTSLVDPSGMPGAQGLVSVKVTRAADGTPLANAPVTLAVTTGVSTISTTTTPGSLTSVSVLTNSSGIASAYVTFTSFASDMLVATVHSGSQATSISININPPFTNSSIPGSMRLWLKADDPNITISNGAISVWPDNSGFTTANNATQANASQQPTLVANGLNGHPVVHFNGGTGLNLPNVLSGAGATEFFVVTKATTMTPSTQRRIWNFGTGWGTMYPNSDGTIAAEETASNSSRNLGTPPQNLAAYHLYNVSSQNGYWANRFNGLLWYQATANQFATNSAPTLGGGLFGTFYDGDIAEVIVYGAVLTSAQRDLVGAYLGSKYGLYTVPPAPANLTASPLSPSQISLRWSAPPRGDHVNYLVERSTDGVNFTQVASVADGLSCIDAGLAPATTYTYRVRAQGYAGISDYNSSNPPVTATTLLSGAGADMPLTSQQGMCLWLKADAGVAANAGHIGTWIDQSGSGNHATQGSGSNQPTLVVNGLNGRPVVHFNGSQGLNLPNVLSGASQAEFFVVTKATTVTPSTQRRIWNFGTGFGTEYPNTDGTIAAEETASNSSRNLGTPPQNLAAYHLYNVSSQNGYWANRFNGLLWYQATTNQFAVTSAPTLGYGQSNIYYDGEIAEVIVYNQTLTPAQRDAVSVYLGNKYALYTVPPAPTNLSATPLSQHQISLQWSAPPRGDHVDCLVERSTGGENFVQVASVADGSSYIDTSLTAATTYTYRVRAQGYAGTSDYNSSNPPVTATTLLSGAGADMPLTSQQGMCLWLKADTGVAANVGHISTWADQSGSGNDATQGTGSNQPVLVTSATDQTVPNSRPVVYFNGSTGLKLPNLLGGANAAEFFVVTKATTLTPPIDRRIWNFGSGFGTEYPNTDGTIAAEETASNSSRNLGTPPQNLTTYHLYNVSSQNGYWANRFNGLVWYSTASNQFTTASAPSLGYSIGNNRYYDGEIAEVIVYNRMLSPLEREAVGAYITSKYSLTPPTSLVAPTIQPSQFISSGQATLSWWPQNPGLAYLIERSVDGGAFTQIAEVDDTHPASGTISYTDANIPGGNVMAYRIRAVGGASISPYSNIGYAFASTGLIDLSDGLSYATDVLLGLNPLADNSGFLPAYPTGYGPPPPPPPDPNDHTGPTIILLTPSQATLN